MTGNPRDTVPPSDPGPDRAGVDGGNAEGGNAEGDNVDGSNVDGSSAAGAAPHAADLGAATARLLLAAGAIAFSREHPFILAAGWASPVYVDCRRLIGEPGLRHAMTDLAAAKLRQDFPASLPFDALAGAETAGIPWACWLADRLDLPLRYVRKRALGVGQNAQVEGGPVEGMRVLLVDDLTTDGGSKVAFARGLRSAGATVTEALCLFYHGTFPGGAERLTGLGLRLHALATWSDVLSVGRDSAMPPHDHAELERFLADPVGWSALHGGRTTPIVPENLSRGSGRGNAGALTTTPCAGSAAPPP
jgi:orotate phosphoribosyltransferase